MIAGPAPGGQFEKSVAAVAPKITDGTIRKAKELAEAMNKDIVPGDAAFEAEFAVASVSQTHLARYYLRALNASFDLREKTPARVSSAKTTIEHILPEKLSAAWFHIKDDVAKTYLRRIGNLTILTQRQNEEADNHDFLTVKIPIYRGSAFPLSDDVVQESHWDERSIEARQKNLAALAVKIWPIKVK